MGLSFKRLFSRTCGLNNYPLGEGQASLRHIHFPGITPFEKGERIQSSFVNANLDFKKIESRIRKQKQVARDQSLELNNYENELVAKILKSKPLPTLLTFEFENVYTGGRKEKLDPDLPNKIKKYEALGCTYYQLDRGGQTTWHGNGQLTAYLILDLKQFKDLTVKCYVDSVLLTAAENILKKTYGLEPKRKSDPGIWLAVNDKKIVSVGTNIQRAITSYGVGFNVSPDLKYLNSFIMCGLPHTKATSITDVLPSINVTIEEVANQFVREVSLRLGIKSVEHMDGTTMEI